MVKQLQAGAGKKATIPLAKKKEKARAYTEAMKKQKKCVQEESEEDESPPLKAGRRTIKRQNEALYEDESDEDIHPVNVHGEGQIIEIVSALQHNFTLRNHFL